MTATGHLDPAPGSEIFLAEDENRHQGSNSGDIHPMDPFQQGLIIDRAHQEHGRDATQNPIDLLDVRTGELGVHGRTADLHHSQPANQQNENEEQPIKIAK